MALSEAQKAAVRLYTGWPTRFLQLDSRLEQAMSALADLPAHEAQLTNALNNSPPGLLALLAQVDADLLAARSRLKASRVGSLALNPGEIGQLRDEGRRLVGRLCKILGVDARGDVFSGSTSSNYVGK